MPKYIITKLLKTKDGNVTLEDSLVVSYKTQNILYFFNPYQEHFFLLPQRERKRERKGGRETLIRETIIGCLLYGPEMGAELTT